MICLLSFLIAVTGLVPLCTALSNNYGHPNEEFPSSSHSGRPVFGDVNIPLGDGSEEESGNVWSQVAALDTAMYTPFSQLPQGGNFPNPYGVLDPNQAQSSYYQDHQQPHQAYHLPPTQYDLPPSHYDDTTDYANYNTYASMPAMNSNMPFQSYSQPPYEEHAGFTGETHADEQPQIGWTTANSTGEMLLPMSHAFHLPESMQALDRLSLGGLSRIRTGGGQGGGGEAESSSWGREQTARRREGRGKGVAAGEEDSRPREPQSARVTSRREVSASELRMPSTARLASFARQQEREQIKNMVEEQFIQRGLSRNTHEQLVAEQVCEIKITHPGHERAIGRKAGQIVEGWNDARYLYDFHGWNALYRSRVGTLKRRFVANGGGTEEELEWFLLTKFRHVSTPYHGPLSNAAQEQQQNHRAAQVWAHFRRTRLHSVHPDAQVTIPLVAHYLPRYKCAPITILDSLTLIKRYLRSVLRFSYLDIEHLESLLPQSGSAQQAQDEEG